MPDQLAVVVGSVLPKAGTASSRTREPNGKLAMHVPDNTPRVNVHAMPAGELVTTPLPVVRYDVPTMSFYVEFMNAGLIRVLCMGVILQMLVPLRVVTHPQ